MGHFKMLKMKNMCVLRHNFICGYVNNYHIDNLKDLQLGSYIQGTVWKVGYHNVLSDC